MLLKYLKNTQPLGILTILNAECCIYDFSFNSSVETIWKSFWTIEKANSVECKTEDLHLSIGHNKENQALLPSTSEDSIKKEPKQTPFSPKANISSDQMLQLLVSDHSQGGNLKIFLSLRFYVKLKLASLEPQNLQFYYNLGL